MRSCLIIVCWLQRIYSRHTMAEVETISNYNLNPNKVDSNTFECAIFNSPRSNISLLIFQYFSSELLKTSIWLYFYLLMLWNNKILLSCLVKFQFEFMLTYLTNLLQELIRFFSLKYARFPLVAFLQPHRCRYYMWIL